MGEKHYCYQLSSPCTQSVIQCTLLQLQPFGESGPQCPYRCTVTKVPLFHVYISPGGAEKQEIWLHLMRKGLHTPLVILSTWNPGQRGSDEIRPAGLSVRNGNCKCARRGGSVRVGLTNYRPLCCIHAGIESGLMHTFFASIHTHNVHAYH